jgi:hypothetical protein
MTAEMPPIVLAKIFIRAVRKCPELIRVIVSRLKVLKVVNAPEIL